MTDLRYICPKCHRRAVFFVFDPDYLGCGVCLMLSEKAVLEQQHPVKHVTPKEVAVCILAGCGFICLFLLLAFVGKI